MALPETNVFFEESYLLKLSDFHDIKVGFPESDDIVVTVSYDGGQTFVAAETEEGDDSYSFESNALTGAFNVVLENIQDLFPVGTTYVHINDSTEGNSGILVITRSAGELTVTPEEEALQLFTSYREMSMVFSKEGVANHTEDWKTDEALIYVMEQATEEVLQFLRGKFSMEAMLASRWVRIKATYIACYLLSIRQGNHSLYGDLYNKALMDLVDARDGVVNTGMPTYLPAIVQTPMHDARFLREGRLNPLQSTQIYGGQRIPYGGRGVFN